MNELKDSVQLEIGKTLANKFPEIYRMKEGERLDKSQLQHLSRMGFKHILSHIVIVIEKIEE